MPTTDRPPLSVLIIDPDESTAAGFGAVVADLGLMPVVVTHGVEALQRFRRMAPALVVLDLSLADVPARHLLEQLAEGGQVPVIAMVEGPNLRSAVDAMRAGAADVIEKRRGVGELARAIQSLLPLTSRPAAEPGAASRSGDFSRYEAIFHRSDKMRALEPIVARLAALSVPVLIRGESGVGKEHVANAIHYLSERSAQPFVRVACAGLPGEVLEAELVSAVRAANGGTLFLDQVGSLPGSAQKELGRLLDGDGGGLRVLSASSTDMYALVAGGQFSGELYERLAVATLDIPPLRERPEEIGSLVPGLLDRFAAEFQRPAPKLTDDMLAALRAYQWPGNIRELKNVVKRWVVLGVGQKIKEDLAARAAAATRTHGTRNGMTLGLRDIARSAAREAERAVLQAALQRANGNRAAVARQLKVSYKTLLQKLAETGLAATTPSRRRA